MTQEEKARKYDEALERAKEVYHRGYYVSGDIEHIFPELTDNRFIKHFRKWKQK